MAFLDNSGDIILDAVLTDTGRMRLAKGDGSFRIVKFALADDEIDYSLYNGSNPSGSAYYDLEILQTPVLEAFSNNIASMKSKLISISRNNLLYLPQIVPNTIKTPFSLATSLVNNGIILAADKDTEDFLNGKTYSGQAISSNGFMKGVTYGGSYLRVDQGINNSSSIKNQPIDADLKETQYIVEVDNRFAAIIPWTAGSTNQTTTVSTAVPSYIDDDNVASYYFSLGTDNDYVQTLLTDDASVANSIIAGQKGSYLQFKLKSQNDVIQSDYLFEQLGYSLTVGSFSSPQPTNIRAILTSVTITGVTTGAGLSIPLLVVKYIA
jgi:hypothetical protein